MKKKLILKQAILKISAVLLMAVLAFTAIPVMSSTVTGGSADVYAESDDSDLTATGVISQDGVNMRQAPTSSAALITVLSAGTTVEIHKVVFKKKKSIKKSSRWYLVTSGGSTGYVNAPYVDSIVYKNADAYTTDALNYRKGPGTCYEVISSVDAGTDITLLLPASGPADDMAWYLAKVAGKTAYVCADYVVKAAPLRTPTEEQLAGKSELAVALLSNPTRGGKARYVYTFDSSNCQGLFSINGYMGISTPQGLAFSGKKYYVLYGNAAGQRIVTYSAKGKRLKATKFKFAIGHPNGITWDAKTKLCYIFKGHQKTIYTYKPAKNKFGKSKTPFNSSGGAYDNSTGLIYASSKPRMYVFSGDGKFKTLGSYARCSHGITHSAQDCGAGGGLLFHGVSGKNYRTTNFLDIYRPEDGAYLGSIKVALGETESAIVDNEGYVCLLINHSGKTDAVWKTPLNVNDLQF